jgi:hypothetical protein
MTADEIGELAAKVIKAACAETGARPEAVARGDSDLKSGGTQYPIARARGYAAVVLREILPLKQFSTSDVGRMVGANSPDSFLGALEHRLKNGQARWWDDDVAERIRAAAAIDLPDFLKRS